MTDDWQWFWAGEGGRDRILRDEVEGLHARLSSASSQTHRLSSQLATLSGSIESRLNALSAAFDAYVELGDVREELSAYEEPATVRRSVMAAIDALAGGRPASAVDPRGLDYWLPYAMNAVIGLVEGRPDPTALDQARSLSPEADTFVAAVCGALGHGTLVADLLPVVLVGDTVLTEQQRRIWRAAATGVFGDLGGDLGEVWCPVMDREPVGDWASWVTAHGSSPPAGIAWLHGLVTPAAYIAEPVRSAADTPLGQLPARQTDADAGSAEIVPTVELRTVATELIGRGMPAEAHLRQRSRELRALIERPTAGGRAAAEATPATVVAEVRRALLLPSTSESVRTTLLSWVSAPLTAVVDQLVATATSAPPAQEALRGGGGHIVVTAVGADPAAVAASITRLEAAHQVTNTRLIGWGAGAGIAAILALVLAVVGSGWAWLFAIGLVSGIIGTLRQVRARRSTRQAGHEAVQRFRQQVLEATERADAAEQKRSAALVQLTGEAADLQGRLARPVSSTGQAGG
ncbi:MAG TPA: hypothetical protein VIT65_05620 [Microlunatus sp.]